MSYELTGKLVAKFDIVQRTETFKTREFVVEKSEDIGGRTITRWEVSWSRTARSMRSRPVSRTAETIASFGYADCSGHPTWFAPTEWLGGERASQFENDFGTWRERRMSKRQLLSGIREHMEVVGSDGGHVGKVDHVLGTDIELSKMDLGSGFKHHMIPVSWIHHVDAHVHLWEFRLE